MPFVLPADLEVGFTLILYSAVTRSASGSRDVNKSIRYWYEITRDHVRKSNSGSHKLGNRSNKLIRAKESLGKRLIE